MAYRRPRAWITAGGNRIVPVSVKVDQTLNGGFTYPSSESVIGAQWQYSATDHDGIKEGELYFYRWELQPGGKFKLHFVGTTLAIRNPIDRMDHVAISSASVNDSTGMCTPAG